MPGYRLSARGFTNSRTDSMNICAMGLSERFFKVVMPTGCRMSGSLTGSALSPGCLRGRRSEKLTTTVRKRSVASSSFRRMMEVASTVSRGGSRPAARNTPACIAPKSVLGESSTQGSLNSSASSILRRRRVSGLFGPVATTKASRKRISSEYSSPAGRDDRLRDRKTRGRLAHRPAFDDGHQDAEVAQLEPATDPLHTLLRCGHRHTAMRASENRGISL